MRLHDPTDSLKILLYTDLAIRPDQLFWHRDLGLLTQAFRDLGHEAYLVVHLATEPRTTPTIPNELDHAREQPFDMSSEAFAKEEAPPERSEALSALGRQPFEAPPERSKVWSEVGPHPTSAASNIRAQARPATAGQNPPVAGALHSSDRYSESSEIGPSSYSPKILEDPVLWPSPSDVRNASWSQFQKPVSPSNVTALAFVFPPVAIGNSGKTLSQPTKMPAPTGPLLSTPRNLETKD